MSFTFVTQVVLLMLLVVLSIQAEDGPIIYNMDEAPELFEKWIVDFNRTYVDKADKDFHFEQFKINLAKINKLNMKNYPENYALNEFTDYSRPEMYKWLTNTDW